MKGELNKKINSERGSYSWGAIDINIELVARGKYDGRLSVHVSTMFNHRWFFAAIVCKKINQQV